MSPLCSQRGCARCRATAVPRAQRCAPSVGVVLSAPNGLATARRVVARMERGRGWMPRCISAHRHVRGWAPAVAGGSLALAARGGKISNRFV